MSVVKVPGNWKVPENVYAKRIGELLEAYKVVAAREKVEKERKKYATPKRRSFHPSNTSLMSMSGSNLSSNSTPDKYGILGPANRRIKSGSVLNTSVQEQTVSQTIDVQLQTLLKPSLTVTSFEPLSDVIFTKKININSSKLFIKLN